MTEEKVKETIQRTIAEEFYRTEKENLRVLYSMPEEKLKEQENNSVSFLAIQSLSAAGDVIRKALSDLGAPYPDTMWHSISERMPKLSYRYIDWRSFDSTDRDEYHKDVSQSDFQKMLNGKKIMIPAGALLIGSIVLLKVKVIGTVIPIIGIVTAATAIGCVCFKALTGKTNTAPNALASQPNPIQKAIRSVQQENIERLKEWCRKLDEITMQVWKEQMEK